MHTVLVGVGFILAIIGYALQSQSSAGFHRGKAVGLSLFVAGDILLFGEGWGWGFVGLLVVPILIDVPRAVIRRP
jgi:uncharacterized membrane protein (UPF0136 family)